MKVNKYFLVEKYIYIILTLNIYLMKNFLVSGNIASILVLTNKDIDLKPSFVNILICLVSQISVLGFINKLFVVFKY